MAALTTSEKVPVALEMERVATTVDPRVSKTDSVQYGDTVGRVAIASTAGVRGEFSGTGCWAVVVTLAEQDDETQTGFSFKIAPPPQGPATARGGPGAVGGGAGRRRGGGGGGGGGRGGRRARPAPRPRACRCCSTRSPRPRSSV